MWKNKEKTGADNGFVHASDTGQASGERGPTRGKVFKWTVLGLIILYTVLAFYHVQILTGLGRYLVVEHTPSKSDLIVCLAGGNIERGLTAAECYQKGLAPRIFIAPEEPPDGLELLRSRSIQYPQSIDLFLDLLQKLGVPKSAVLVGEQPSGSTAEEARMVGELVGREGYRSIILVTSPTHTRRCLLTFRKILPEEVRIQVVPSPYSKFKPEDWWKHRRYLREVLLEYQKLAYYHLKELR